MSFFEPERTQFDLNFRLLGFPVRISPWFWVIAAFLGASSKPQTLVLWILAMLVGIIVHELGHALAMRYYGFQPEIILHGAGGLTTYNTDNYINRRFLTNRDKIIIDGAGPGAGFLLFALIGLGLYAIGVNPFNFVFFGMSDEENRSLFQFLSYPVILFTGQFMYICLFWGILNLMPIYPLDGGQIAREICLAINPYRGLYVSLYISFVTALVLGGLALIYGMTFAALFCALFAYESWQNMQIRRY